MFRGLRHWIITVSEARQPSMPAQTRGTLRGVQVIEGVSREYQMTLAVQICAELEWQCTKAILNIRKARRRRQPFGECISATIGKHEAIFYESGATKTRSAAACQFAIDTWHPDGIINLGTCAGVSENVRIRDLYLAKTVFQYDVIERFGKPSLKFRRGLRTGLNLSWVDLSRVSKRVRLGTIASADQDLDAEHRKILQGKGVSQPIGSLRRLQRSAG